MADSGNACASGSGSRSSTSGDSYIGSLISLTSKSEIRYEGVLFAIDTQESSIGLRNVRSYGTEGRKKDGPQIAPSDMVYEYILFRGNDIKDLQVKSSPPPFHSEPQMHNDPAIIQSHYSSVSSASAGGVLTDSIAHTKISASPVTGYPGSMASYQAGVHLGSGSFSPALRNTNEASVSRPLYSHGYYGPPTVPAHVQHQSIPLQCRSTIPGSGALQNQFQYPGIYAPLNTSMPNLSEHASPFPPHPSVKSSIPSNMKSAPTPFPVASSDLSVHRTTLPSLTASLLATSSLASNQEANDLVIPVSSVAQMALVSTATFQSIPYSSSSHLGSLGPLLDAPPALLTPDKLRAPRHPAPSSIQNLYAEQNGMDGLMSSSLKPSPLQGSLLPHPAPSKKLDENVGFLDPSKVGEHELDRGHVAQCSSTQFTEEFDFIAMHEKFKKDEVWGHLSKTKLSNTTGDETQDHPNDYSLENEEDISRPSKIDMKPVYIKDEFFDTLSCNSLNGGAWNRRPKFSDRMRLDTETFGEFQQRHNWSSGGSGIGRSSGSYSRGRGYGHGGRVRGGAH